MLLKAVLSISLILFSVIDIPGSLPVLIDLKKKGISIEPFITTIVAGLIMIAFLFFGVSILGVFHIDISSFAIAGSLIIFFIGLEMILGITIFRDLDQKGASGSIVPVAFPLIAGAGTLTTILSLKAEFETNHILIAIAINLVIVYIVLRATGWLSKVMSETLLTSLRKIFGIILLAIAIQMFKNNLTL